MAPRLATSRRGAHDPACIGRLLSAFAALLRSRSDLILENLALRQQLAVLQSRQPCRRMSASGRFLWVALRRLWPKWRQVLVVVRPEIVVRWHRLDFRA